jgi:hypothetical protein
MAGLVPPRQPGLLAHAFLVVARGQAQATNGDWAKGDAAA